MSKTAKIVVGVIAGVVLLCVIAAGSAGAGFAFSRMAIPMGLVGADAIRPLAQVQPDQEGQPYRMPMYGQGRGYAEDECPHRGGGLRSGDGVVPRGSAPWGFRAPFGMFGADPKDGFEMPFRLDPEGEFGPGRMMGPDGRMWGFGLGADPLAEPLTVEQAVASAQAYLAGIEATDLEVAEVMVFDNHAYVEIKDTATGAGAIELLVDPVSQRAMLEFGPSMMWNTEYGMHAQGGPRGGMMGPLLAPEAIPSGEMTITPDEATAAAQAYLDEALPGRTVEADVETFPGYYTLHVVQDGEVAGMLSVNGYTGQVWYHSWHGDLLEMEETAE